MIKKISQQNKIDWFASFYSLDFDLNDSSQFGPEKYRDFRETYRSQSPKQIRGKDSLPPSPERMGCQSIHRRFTYEWYTIKRKRGAKLSV